MYGKANIGWTGSYCLCLFWAISVNSLDDEAIEPHMHEFHGNGIIYIPRVRKGHVISSLAM